MQIRIRFLAWIAITALVCGLPAIGKAQQASLVLDYTDTTLCYKHHNDWALTKVVTSNPITTTNRTGTVTFKVTATKTSGATGLNVIGALTVTNAGSADATIGNIVVNLQKKAAKNAQKIPWVSVAADIANATDGPDATTGRILAKTSAEHPTVNAAQGAGNYTISGAEGTFVRTAGSGSVTFMDLNTSEVFSLVPQSVIAPGETVTLLFNAGFDMSAPGMPAPGEQIKVEALVSFGNAGARGGSGASGSNIDINGNGVIDADEANVRTVPSRMSLHVPSVAEECNDSVILSDLLADVATTGTVTFANFQTFGGGAGIVELVDGDEFTVSVLVDAGPLGGTLTNTARLHSEDQYITLNIVDPVTGLPIRVVCCDGIDLQASDGFVIGPAGFQAGDYCTFRHGSFHSQNEPGGPGDILVNNFLSVFPAGLQVGQYFPFNGAAAPNGFFWQPNVTGRTRLKRFTGGGGGSGPIPADALNPTSPGSAGAIAREVAALTLNVEFNDAGLYPSGLTVPPFGNLVLCNTGTSLDGLMVRHILVIANTALATGVLPIDYTFGRLDRLIGELNFSFDYCTVSGWAQTHLCP